LLEDAGHLPFEERGRLLGGGVGGADAGAAGGDHDVRAGRDRSGERLADRGPVADHAPVHGLESAPLEPGDQEDRKSTRLNSSHVSLSYAVCCLKKKVAENETCGRGTCATTGR